jgi:predicted ATPase
MTQLRLAKVSVQGLRGLPGVEIGLRPMTALIGPRGVGKSRLLAAVAWLLTGDPDLGGDSFSGEPSVVRASGLVLRATLVDASANERQIERRPGGSSPEGIPTGKFLPARDRLPPFPEDAPIGWSDAAQAEQMVETIAEKRLSGASGEILIIEEPELMLTPHQQRHLYELLRRYAENGNQVVYSTRSPAMLDAAHHDEIVRLDRHADGMSAFRAAQRVLSDEQSVRLAAEFDHERNEMFFATAVVLVEGNTERLALPLIFRRLGHDPDALGMSIVEVGGKGNLVLIARVLAELRIPHLIVFDSDRGRPGQQENDYIRSHAGKAPIIELDPDFEGVAGIRGHDDKVFTAWQRFTDIDANRIPSEFREIAETAVRLASGG